MAKLKIIFYPSFLCANIKNKDRKQSVTIKPQNSCNDKYWLRIKSAIIVAKRGSVKAKTEAVVIPIAFEPIKKRT